MMPYCLMVKSWLQFPESPNTKRLRQHARANTRRQLMLTNDAVVVAFDDPRDLHFHTAEQDVKAVCEDH